MYRGRATHISESALLLQARDQRTETGLRRKTLVDRVSSDSIPGPEKEKLNSERYVPGPCKP